ncbi:flagellar assembly protein FliH [Domibacillus robiginosus]|uniref:flagellar assembly protein FliH n=1 Tax=Domibacillus robiginosus TaxID=1071054 RepID=UPI00067D98AF|nr:flagellar assembly protein FliH [Domibacillus robiginosus]
MFNFETHDWPVEKEKGTRIIGVKPIYTQDGQKETAKPDFSYERAQVLEKANNQAKAILSQAEARRQQIEQEAANWQQSWEQEKEQLQKEAYDQAFKQGAEQGREAGYQEMKQLIEEAYSVVASSKIEYEKNVERSERTVVELAIMCAEKIIRTELNQDDEAFMKLVRSALKETKNQKEIQIHVHPGKYDLVISQKDEIEALFPNEINCYIFPNEEAGEDACFIETSNGRIDAGVDTQLNQLRKTLLELLESE